MGDVFKNIKDSTIYNRSKINVRKQANENAKPKKPSEKQIEKLKLLIQQNKLETCLEELMTFFKTTGNKEGLKEAILFSSKLTEIKQMERHELVSLNKSMQLRSGLKQGILGLLEEG